MCAITALNVAGEAFAVVGISGGVLIRARHGDIGEVGVDVAAKTLQVGHDPIARRPLCGMNRGDPCGPDVAVGDVGHVEGLALTALHADHDDALVGVDREHFGGAPIEAFGGIVVAGELDAVAVAEFLLDSHEGVGLGAAAVAGGPGERRVLGVEQVDGAGLGVDGLDTVAGVAVRRAALPALAERHDMAGTVAGGFARATQFGHCGSLGRVRSAIVAEASNHSAPGRTLDRFILKCREVFTK